MAAVGGRTRSRTPLGEQEPFVSVESRAAQPRGVPGAVPGPLLGAGLASAPDRVPWDPEQLWVHPSLELTSLHCTVQDSYSPTVIFHFFLPFYPFETRLTAAWGFFLIGIFPSLHL